MWNATLAQHLLITSFMVLIVSVLSSLVRGRPALVHVLWLIVLVKFAVPPQWLPSPALPIPSALCDGIVRAVSPQQPITHREGIAKSTELQITVSSSDGWATPDEFLSQDAATSGTDMPSAHLFAAKPRLRMGRLARFVNRISTLGLIVWLLGAVYWALRSWRQISGMQTLIKRSSTDNGQWQQMTNAIADELQVPRVPIVITPHIATPLVWCFGRPKICWPRNLVEGMDSNQKRAMLIHEMAHVRRRDHWVAWLELATYVGWWWNPCYLWARRQLRASAELACDQWVVQLMPAHRRSYAEALIAAGRAEQHELAPTCVGATRGGRKLGRRLAMIMTERNMTSRSGWIFIGALVLGLVSMPAWRLVAPQTATADEPSQAGVVEDASIDSSSQAETPAKAAAGEAADKTNAVQDDKSASASVVKEVLEQIESNYFEKVDSDRLMKSAIDSVMSQLNAEMEYFDAPKLEQVRIGITGSLEGIGAQLALDKQQRVVVVKPLPGSPAAATGVLPGDIIIQVEDRELAGVAAANRIETAAGWIRGKAGTAVKLLIERPGEATPLALSVTRGAIVLRTVSGYQRDSTGRQEYFCDPERKIAYIRITHFADTTLNEFQQAAQELTAAGMRALVLDLRFNPGGTMMAAVGVADTLLDSGAIIDVVPRDEGAKTSYSASRDQAPLSVPVAVLVNSSTASAAEILAASLQDNERAAIVGERTRGIGLVKSLVGLSNGAALKIPTASLVRPNGKRLQRDAAATENDVWGVTPDDGALVALTAEQSERLSAQLSDQQSDGSKNVKDDPQLSRAIEILSSSL
jgi:carboxyl-terminal processing protease